MGDAYTENPDKRVTSIIRKFDDLQEQRRTLQAELDNKEFTGPKRDAAQLKLNLLNSRWRALQKESQALQSMGPRSR